MKKRAKKLVLAKETVRDLAVDLREVAGGTTWQPTCAGCGTVQCWSNPDYSCQDEVAPIESTDC